MRNEVLLGQDFCENFCMNLDFKNNVAQMGKKAYKIQSRIVNMKPPAIHRVEEVKDAPNYLKTLTKHTVFREEIGHCVHGKRLGIKTKGSPIKQRPYRQPLTKRIVVEEEIEKMLKSGVIQPSESPWASPITLVPKKTGEVRFCVDYRKINNITEKDAYPLPNIQEIFDTLGGASVFTTLDLRSGYWQIDMDAESIPKTAFVCHKGLYEFTRLPFGLTNAPSQFQRIMNSILAEHIGKICLVYIDDIIIFSKTELEHQQHVETILEAIHKAGMTLKLSKCEFGKEKVQLLGYVVSKDGIAPQE